jgi:hypothetical protein
MLVFSFSTQIFPDLHKINIENYIYNSSYQLFLTINNVFFLYLSSWGVLLRSRDDDNIAV